MELTLKFAILTVISFLIAGCGSNHGERELLKGRKALESGDFVLAKTWLQNSINKTADTETKARVYNYLGVACWNLQELQQAFDAFRTARELNPEFQNAVYNLGILAMKKGDTQTAIALMQEAAILNTRKTRPLEHLGAIYLDKKLWADARRIYIDAMKNSPDSPRIITAAGLAEFHLQRATIAREHWLKAIELDKSYAPALYNLAVVDLTLLRKHDEGIKLANQFLLVKEKGEQTRYIKDLIAKSSTLIKSTNPAPNPPNGGKRVNFDDESNENQHQDVLDLARSRRRSGESAYALNLCLQEAGRARRKGDRDRQLETLLTAVKICFEQPRAHYALGRFYMENNKPEKARDALRQAVALEPEWTDARVAVAKCSIILEEYDTAIISLKKALKQDGRNREALWALARLYDKHTGDAGASVKIYQKFSNLFPGDTRVLTAQERINIIQPSENQPLTTDPSPTRAHTVIIRNHNAAVIEFNQGVNEQSRQNWSAAIKHYQQAVKLDERFVRAHFNLGVAYGATDHDVAAEKAYLATIDLDPDYVNARFNLALIHFSHKDYINATKQLNLLIKTDPSYAKAHFLMGMIASKLNKNNQAKSHYRKFLQLAPRDPNATQIRTWLQQH